MALPGPRKTGEQVTIREHSPKLGCAGTSVVTETVRGSCGESGLRVAKTSCHIFEPSKNYQAECGRFGKPFRVCYKLCG